MPVRDACATLLPARPALECRGRGALGHGCEGGMLFEAEAHDRMVSTKDRREGVAALNVRRRPSFKGS